MKNVLALSILFATAVGHTQGSPSTCDALKEKLRKMAEARTQFFLAYFQTSPESWGTAQNRGIETIFYRTDHELYEVGRNMSSACPTASAANSSLNPYTDAWLESQASNLKAAGYNF